MQNHRIDGKSLVAVITKAIMSVMDVIVIDGPTCLTAVTSRSVPVILGCKLSTTSLIINISSTPTANTRNGKSPKKAT